MKKISLLLTIVLMIAASTFAQKKVMLMNRIGPSQSTLFIANADGTDEHPLFPTSGFDYNASFSLDGKWIDFTSERTGAGQADIYRVHPDGSGLERLTDNPALDDQGVISPDGTQMAFVSTRDSKLHNANIWILDLKTKKYRNLTGGPDLQSTTPGKPNAFLRPAWSPDGKWIAFSSDRNSEWAGSERGAGAGHTQELSVYVIQPDGKGLKRLTPPGITAGSPKWSTDGKSVVCYEMAIPMTQTARGTTIPPTAVAQIISIDVSTGTKTEITSGPGLKVSPQPLGGERTGYLVKAAATDGIAGIAYTTGGGGFAARVRNPAWSPNGKLVIYEKWDFTARPQYQLLYSWDPNREFRYTDVFPSFSVDGKLSITDLNSQMGNPTTAISVLDADGSNKKDVYHDPAGAAMMQSWSPDGKQLVFGFGGFFGSRSNKPAALMMVNADGSDPKTLTEGLPNAGFPSWSPDGKSVVYRVWGDVNTRGLRILNLADHSVKTLTTDWDDFPIYSPTGDRITFTRHVDNIDFEIFTIRPDGTDLKRLTHLPGNDGHATWIDNNTMFFSSSIAGFKDEAPLYDASPQPYAQVFIMNADGSDVHQITDSRWEDSMAVYVPANAMKATVASK